MSLRKKNEPGNWLWISSRAAIIWIWTPIVVISIAHYLTPEALHGFHGIYRRLYYIPIIVGAFRFGFNGAVLAALMASLAYIPHALGLTTHLDPGSPVEKASEVALYLIVAIVTGSLAGRERRERARQAETARRLGEALEDLRMMEKQLIRAGRLQALGEMTAGLAHEIRNPLASLRGATDIIADEIAPDSPRRRMVEILRKELERLNALLDRFLAFARPSAFQFRAVDALEIVEKVNLLLEPRIQAARIDWTITRPRNPVIIHADPAQIEQVLVNLILNALQVMPDGGRMETTITRASRGRRLYAVFSVEDTGPGFPEDAKEKIFNPFFTTKENGTGLGLSIAARIVDEHQGFIEAENLAIGGASFRVFLPIAEAHNESGAGERSADV